MISNTFMKKIYSKKTLKRINQKINLLGVSTNFTNIQFLNIRFGGIIFLFGFCLIAFKYGYLYGIFSCILYYFGITYYLLDIPIKKRKRKLETEAILFFEILNFSLENGKNLIEALEITTKNVDGDLTEEFKKTLEEIKIGKSLSESIKAMKNRIPSDTINMILLNLVKASSYGNSFIQNELNYLKEKRNRKIHIMERKLPIKISLLLILFLLPILLILVLSPIMVQILVK